ncbi:MAG: cupin domain-containing protein [Sphingomonadaceae bacterium]
MLRGFVIAAALAASLSGACAAVPDDDTLPSDDLRWQEIVPGVVSFAPAHGHWEEGAHGRFARIEPGATVPMHIHSRPYHAVLMAGRMTNLLDSGPTRVDIGPGDYWYMAAGRAHGHVCTSPEPCMAYVHSDGAFDLTLVE